MVDYIVYLCSLNFNMSGLLLWLVVHHYCLRIDIGVIHGVMVGYIVDDYI